MGAQFLSTCYETVAEAATEFYQRQDANWLVDAKSIQNRVYFNGTAWRSTQVEYSATGVKTVRWDTPADPVQFPYCAQSETSAQFTDGVLLGWGVVAAMAIAWGFKMMRREAGR